MTTAVSGQDLADILRQRLPEAVVASDDVAVLVRVDSIVAVCSFLQGNPEQDFKLLNSITSVDYIDHFELVYRITSLDHNASAVLKLRVVGRDEPTVPSVSSVWAGANLQEREVYDLMGIHFSGHPNLKRVFLWEGFQGHPLRRDYLEPPLPYTWPQGG